MSDSITPSDWRRIEPILDGALDLAPAQRATWLDAACAGDAVLRSRLEALLAAARDAGSFLDTLVAPRLAAGRRLRGGAADAAAPGTRIGPYRVVQELGRGGMGVVFVAEPDDEPFEPRVALKLIRFGMAGDDVLRRFLRERRILARLEHPGIARLLDGGLTADGRPWFAMEYVQGEPITRHADKHNLTIDERLQLFERACDAVRHAHGVGVVHRDLKPANLLVSTAGDVKLLDFGIARLLEGDAEDPSVTRTGVRLLTPGYAAPEQVRGEAVTPATDVHGLGIILYELLCGHHPFRTGPHDSAAGIERRVCEGEPASPSARVTRVGRRRGDDGPDRMITPESVSRARASTPARLRLRLAGDLDGIVLRALDKNPARRYVSVDALLDDLRRHRCGLPVRTRQGVVPRLRRLARRHRAAATGAAAALLFAGIAGFEWIRVVAPSADAAAAARLAAGTVSPVAHRLYEEGLRAFHQHDLHGARRLLRAALAEDPTFALAAYYVLRTEWALALPPDDELEQRLHRLAPSLPERERLLLRGRMAWNAADPVLTAVAESLVVRHPAEPEGHLFVGRALAGRGTLYGALPHLRRALALDSLGLQGVTADCRGCEAFNALIATYFALDSLPAIERTAREWVLRQPGSGQAWFALAGVLEWQGRSEDALVAVRRAAPLTPGHAYTPIYPALLDIREGAFESGDRLLHEQVRAGPPNVEVEALWFLVISLRYQGRLREALEITRSLALLRPELSAIAEAQVLLEMGHARDAAALFDAIAARSAASERSPSARARAMAWHLTHAAGARAAAGDTVGLQLMADSIAALGTQALGAMHRRLHHHVRGLLLAARGDTAAAVGELRRAAPGPDAITSPYGRTGMALARMLLALDRPQEAIAVLQPAFRGPLEAAGFYATHTELHELLGRAFDAAGEPDSARHHYRHAVNAWRDADPGFQERRAVVQRRLAGLAAR